jgi:hypothetical protein
MPSYTAVPFPTFQPAMRLIAAMTNSNPCSITTSFAHQYISGTVVRLHIPEGIGMEQADGLTGTIQVISPLAFTLNIDTTNFDPLLSPTGGAQVIPIGENSFILGAATQNVLPY